MFELQGDLLEMITNQNHNVDLANLSDKNVKFEFAKEQYSDEKAPGNKILRDRSLVWLLKSLAILASGFSTIFLPQNPIELCDRLKLLLREK